MRRKSHILLLVPLLLVIHGFFMQISSAQRAKRCFVCRSRGPLGDCKDPFMYNASTIDDSGLKAVESQPCASGWCGKSIESSDGEHIIATERMCLQRPPSDNQERCAETFYGNRKKTFFMCFCKGDLCNEATRTSINTITVVLTSLCLLLR